MAARATKSFETIEKIRRKLRLSQTDFAHRLGYHNSTYSCWRYAGKVTQRVYTAAKLLEQTIEPNKGKLRRPIVLTQRYQLQDIKIGYARIFIQVRPKLIQKAVYQYGQRSGRSFTTKKLGPDRVKIVRIA